MFSLTHVSSDCIVLVGVLVLHSAVVAKCLLRVMDTEEKQYGSKLPRPLALLTFSIFYPIACENNYNDSKKTSHWHAMLSFFLLVIFVMGDTALPPRVHE